MGSIGHNSRTPDAIAHRMVELGHDWADKNAAASLLEESAKSVLAELTSDYRRDAKSIAEADMLARADRRYREHISRMVEARRLANRARVNFDAIKVETELQRTAEATRRAEMGMR